MGYQRSDGFEDSSCIVSGDCFTCSQYLLPINQGFVSSALLAMFLNGDVNHCVGLATLPFMLEFAVDYGNLF